MFRIKDILLAQLEPLVVVHLRRLGGSLRHRAFTLTRVPFTIRFVFRLLNGHKIYGRLKVRFRKEQRVRYHRASHPGLPLLTLFAL